MADVRQLLMLSSVTKIERACRGTRFLKSKMHWTYYTELIENQSFVKREQQTNAEAIAIALLALPLDVTSRKACDDAVPHSTKPSGIRLGVGILKDYIYPAPIVSLTMNTGGLGQSQGEEG